MRVSRLHIADVPGLFLFKYPVRCHACLERYHVSVSRALDLSRLSAEQVPWDATPKSQARIASSLRPPFYDSESHTAFLDMPPKPAGAEAGRIHDAVG
jgi:hypothetical protein